MFMCRVYIGRGRGEIHPLGNWLLHLKVYIPTFVASQYNLVIASNLAKNLFHIQSCDNCF